MNSQSRKCRRVRNSHCSIPICIAIMVLGSVFLCSACAKDALRGMVEGDPMILCAPVIQTSNGTILSLHETYKKKISESLISRGFNPRWLTDPEIQKTFHQSVSKEERLECLASKQTKQDAYGLLLEFLVYEEFYQELSQSWAYKIKTRLTFTRQNDSVIFPSYEDTSRVFIPFKDDYLYDIFRNYSKTIQELILQFVHDEFYAKPLQEQVKKENKP